MTTKSPSYLTLAACMTKANAWVSYYNTSKYEVIQNVVKDLEDAKALVSHVHLTTDHDGYDRYGPKSDLYTLAVWAKTPDNNYYIRFYEAEMWYCEGEKCVYGLWKSYHFANPMQWAYTKHHMTSTSRYTGKHGWSDCFDLIRYLDKLDAEEHRIQHMKLKAEELRLMCGEDYDAPELEPKGICPCGCTTSSDTRHCCLAKYDPDTNIDCESYEWTERDEMFDRIYQHQQET